jgi:peptide/nickel transport system substrate-binding protein
MLGLAVSACTADSGPPEDTELSMRVQGIPGAWNPVSPDGLPWAGRPTQGAVYEPLIRAKAEDGVIVFEPWLASEFELSDDGMTLNITLRDDVDFIDGVHMNAAGVEEFLTEWISVPAAAVIAEHDTEAKATGEYELVLTTTKPMRSKWFSYFADLPLASPEAIKDPDSLLLAPVGTGPYIIDELVPDVSISFIRNPNYWNPDAFDFDKVTMTVFDDEIAALNALKTGQLDVAYLIEVASMVDAKSSGLRLFTAPGAQPALFILDRDGVMVPALADVRVRQAMNLAFDREAINDSLNQGLGTVSSQPFQPGSLGYVEGGDDRYGYDPERAKELLAEAGYPDGFDLTIPIFGTDNYEPVVQQALTDIGIRVTLAIIPEADYGALFNGTWNGSPVALFPWASSAEATFDVIGLYYGGYPDELTRSLYHDVEFGNQNERAQAAKELGEIILDEAWYVPFSNPPTGLATREGITAVATTLSGGADIVPLWEYRLDD